MRGASGIATLAEQIDAHRKRQQQLHPGLTLTNCYNVLERLRRIAAATLEQVARRFKRARTAKVAELLETLSNLGQLRQPEPGRFAA